MYYMSQQSNLSVRIPQSLRRQVDELSEREERPLSEIVRDSLQRYVAARKFELLRRKILPFAEAQGFLTDEDVFKAIS
jgi:predicted transcriptional regulator